MWMRRGVVVAAVGSVTVAILGLSFADRAPWAVERFLDAVLIAASQLEERLGVDWLDRSDVPLSYDLLGHMALWSAAAFVGWFSLNGRLRPLPFALGLILVSGVVEIGQAFLTRSRSTSVEDFAANIVGVAIGLMIAALAEQAQRQLKRVRSLSR